MTEFLSETALLRLREHLNGLRLRLSILQKSVNGIKIDNINDIMRQNIPRDIKREALDLLVRIQMEALFLDSFAPVRFQSSTAVLTLFGSTGALLNRIFAVAMDNPHGYVTVAGRRGKIEVEHYEYPHLPAANFFDWGASVLAVDICEHAYYLDYGFDKRAYLLAALPYLALSRLDGG